VEDRLLALTDGHTDLVGAAISATEPAQGAAQPFIFEVRIVVYTRPNDIAAVKQGDTLQAALKAALTAVERQVREKREKLGKPWERSDIPSAPGSSDETLS
jgi:hypothetical protein